MKKLISLSLSVALVFAFAACKKTNNSNGTNPFYTPPTTTTTTTADPLANVGAVPGSFTKKVILEEFTGEWCGYCPDGAQIMEDLTNANPNRFYGVAVHQGDFMEVPAFFTFMETLYGAITGFPSGAVNRGDVVGRGNWTSLVNTELAKTADCGLAIEAKESGDNLNLKVFVGHNAAIGGATKLTIYLIENDIDQVSQTNGGAGYKHQHVFRKVFTDNYGDDISIGDAKKYAMKEYKNLDISGMYKNKANCHILAFVNIDGAGKTVLNAQLVGLNETKKWD
ncbi:MAG: Omp28-related outer membrane protein [Chitinophagaceae bacterium]|nr:Omp28-related outer membrane protein [Chitinophagaceae bacterium]